MGVFQITVHGEAPQLFVGSEVGGAKIIMALVLMRSEIDVQRLTKVLVENAFTIQSRRI